MSSLTTSCQHDGFVANVWQVSVQAAITTRLVKSLSPQATPYEIFDTKLTGFLLRIQPSVSMSYYLAYRALDGRGKRFRVGRADALTVAQARDLAEKYMAQVMTGVDVQDTRKQQREEAQRAQLRTLGGFLDTKYAAWVQAERKSGGRYPCPLAA